MFFYRKNYSTVQIGAYSGTTSTATTLFSTDFDTSTIYEWPTPGTAAGTTTRETTTGSGATATNLHFVRDYGHLTKSKRRTPANS